MDRRRFFTSRTLTESVMTADQRRSLFEDTFNELNRLYEAYEQKQDADSNATDAAPDTEAAPDVPDKENTQDPAESTQDAGEAKEVLDDLKDSSYVDFVKILDSDGKSKAFLSYLRQHYKLGDDSIKTVKQANAKLGKIKCSALVPTQANISLSKSLGMINKPGWSENIINTPLEAFNDPTVTYAGKYIIDGHHRWSKAYALNGGDSEIKVLNFPAIDGVTWEDMLKAVQLAIVATVPNAKLHNPVEDDNMLKASDDVIKKFVTDNICEEVIAAMKAKGRGETAEAIADTVAANVAEMRSTSKPVAGAQPRAYMPQIPDEDKGGDKTKKVLNKAVIDLV